MIRRTVFSDDFSNFCSFLFFCVVLGQDLGKDDTQESCDGGAADIDAAEVAKDIGVAAERAVDFVCDGGGLGLGYDAVDRAVRNVRNRRRVEDADDDGCSWRDQIDRDYQARR